MRRRFLALLIDFFIVILLCWIAFILFGAPDWGKYLKAQDAVRGLPASDPLVIERSRQYQQCFVVSLVIAVVYEAFTLVIFNASPGKLIMRMRVISAKEGGNIVVSKLMLALRSLIKALSIYLLSAIPFILLCVTTFGNIDKRSGFDIFTGTKVIDTVEVVK